MRATSEVRLKHVRSRSVPLRPRRSTAATLSSKPSDLTDTVWKHGPSDGEIFALIQGGVWNTSMRGDGGRLVPQELRSLVNHMRTLGSNPPKSQ